MQSKPTLKEMYENPGPYLACCERKRVDILRDATNCVRGQRDARYGEPEDNFAVIGRFWSQYLKEIGFADKETLLPDQVAMMMVLFKLARSIGGPSIKDNYVDMAGYAACGGECALNLQERLEAEEDIPDVPKTANSTSYPRIVDARGVGSDVFLHFKTCEDAYNAMEKIKDASTAGDVMLEDIYQMFLSDEKRSDDALWERVVNTNHLRVYKGGDGNDYYLVLVAYDEREGSDV